MIVCSFVCSFGPQVFGPITGQAMLFNWVPYTEERSEFFFRVAIVCAVLVIPVQSRCEGEAAACQPREDRKCRAERPEASTL